MDIPVSFSLLFELFFYLFHHTSLRDIHFFLIHTEIRGDIFCKSFEYFRTEYLFEVRIIEFIDADGEFFFGFEIILEGFFLFGSEFLIELSEVGSSESLEILISDYSIVYSVSK